MDNNSIDIDYLKAFINDALNESGKIALSYFRQIRDLSLKGDSSPVTLADKDIEKFLRERISSSYPTHNITGEEFDTLDNNSNVHWIIDPIDGTRSFVAGKYDFGTLIAIVENNEVIAGVIDCPALEERWSCFGDSFTEVNGRKTQCKSVQKLEDAVMATTSSHEFGMQKWRSYQSLEKSVKVTTTGSDCYNYGLLASGHIDLIAEKLTAPHDYLPLTKIVEGAGGIMTDWEGKKLGLHDKHVYVLASASEELHNLALEKLRTKE